MMKEVSESLAGRVGVLSMYSLSRAEIEGRESKPFNPANVKAAESSDTVSDIYDMILRGGMPRLISDPGLSYEDYFGSYVQTYIERDIRELTRVKDENKFN